MRKACTIITGVMIVVTFVTFCGIGAWSNWNSSPTGTDTEAVDAMELAVVGTWFYSMLLPTLFLGFVTWIVHEFEPGVKK